MATTPNGRARFVAASLVAMSTAGLAPMPADAAFAGHVTTATGAMRVLGRDKVVYEVSAALQAIEPAGGAASYSFAIGIAKCSYSGCEDPRWYKVPLAPGSATISGELTSATVSATFQGLPVRLSWAGDGATGANVDVQIANDGVGVSHPSSGPAGLSGQVLGVNCGGEGGLVRHVRIGAGDPQPLDGSPAPGRPTSAFTKVRGRGPSCVRG